MSTLLRALAGIALMALGFFMARIGCMALVQGVYTGSVLSILAGILGIGMIAVGIYLFIKGWNW
jgi:hypothetical protein